MHGCPSSMIGMCSLAANCQVRSIETLIKAVAEHASTTRIECGGWASLPAEDSRLRQRDTWRPRTPPGRYIGSTRMGGPDRRGEVPDPYGGPSHRLLARSFPSSRTRGVTGPVPELGAGPGPLAR